MGEMTARDIVDQAAVRAPVTSQATSIEQSRAAAQVLGALQVAKTMPRDEIAAAQRMREACQSPELASRAFYSFRRGGQQVNGPSIHMATELARCWGNIDYGIVELHRDDSKGESEMLAVAWDLETNTRVVNSFIAPHRRDTKGGGKQLTETRDIYENNANLGARRLRECLFRILPVHFREAAIERCHATLRDGGGIPLPDRREKLLQVFSDFGVTRAQIEERVGVAVDRLNEYQIANLSTVYQSLKRGETTVADEFEPDQGKEIKEGLADNSTPPAKPKRQKKAAPKPEAEQKPDPESENPAPAASAPQKNDWETVDLTGDIAQFETPAQAASDLVSMTGKARSAADVHALQEMNSNLFDHLREAQCDRQVAELMNATKSRLAELKQP